MNASIGKRRSGVLLLLTAALLAAAFLAAGSFHFRLDLSRDGSNSLSKLSRELYKEIPERVRLSYYLSPAFEARYPGPRAVRDLLREVEAASRGKISLGVYDPGREAGSLEALGLAAQRMQVVEENEQRVAVVYSGLVVEYLERTEVIPFVFDASTLEYDLIKAVRRAVSGRPQRAALLVGDADKAFDTDYKTVSEALRRSGWELEELSRGAPVPAEVQVLLVLGNAGLEDYDVYRIDEFLARGGAAFIAARGVMVEAREALLAYPLEKNPLAEALKSYGVEIKGSLVLDRSSLSLPYQDQSPQGGSAIRYLRYPHWVAARPEFSSRDNPVTARLSGLDLFWPSPLDLKAPPGVEGEVLVRSTPRAWLQTSRFALRPEEEPRFAEEAEATTGSYGLVAALSGRLPEAFAGKSLPKREGAAPLEPLPAEPRPSRLLVVGSSDFATDLMTMTDSSFNAGFIAQAVEWLGSGPELAAVKARGGRDPRLAKIGDPAGRSLAIVFAYGLNLLIIPGGFALYGLLRLRRRRALARGLPSQADFAAPGPGPGGPAAPAPGGPARPEAEKGSDPEAEKGSDPEAEKGSDPEEGSK